MIRKHVIIQGRVQGVGFRYSARGKAERWGLAGYVRNLADGSVEVEIEGGEASVARMLAWLQTGPYLAVVDRIQDVDVPVIGENRFSVTH